MRLVLVLSFAVLAVASINAQSGAEAEIRQLLESQTVAWNKGDLEGFMQGYIKGDDLQFVGKSGLTKGWESTLQRYKSRYSNNEAMGQLKFELHEINKCTDDVYTVVGQYFLSRETMEDLNGYFLLVVVKTRDGWRVAADSTH